MRRLTMSRRARGANRARTTRLLCVAAVLSLTSIASAPGASAQVPPGGMGTSPVQPGTIQPTVGMIGPRKTVLSMAGAPPTNVRATATGPRSVEIRWTAPAGASGYWVSRAPGGATNYVYVSQLVTDTAWTDISVLPGTSYSYTVSSQYPAGSNRDKGVSESASATTLAAPTPTGLAAVHKGNGVIAVQWDKLAGASSYRLFRDGGLLSDVRGIVSGNLVIGATSYTDSVPPGTHGYQLQAVFRADNASDVLSTLAPQPPVTVTVTASTKVKYCVGGTQ